MNYWYPEDKDELNKILNSYLKHNPKQDLHGLVVPHAGYNYSGRVAGKAFSLIPKNKKAIVIGPSHYEAFQGIKTLHEDRLTTPLGKLKLTKNNFNVLNVPEHSITNQFPFLQKLEYKEALPLVVGNITNEQAKQIAKELSKQTDYIFVFSTDLSHFLTYEQAVKTDKKSIEIIEQLDLNKTQEIDACGKYPLLILMNLCKLKSWKPKLIEYKNSGDITGDKSQVVGYSSFWF